MWKTGLAALGLVSAASTPAAWHEARSKHFVIYADGKPEVLRTFAERLERFDKAMRVFRQMDDPELSDANRLTIFVLNSEQAVSRLIGDSGAAGMYASRAGGAFAFVPRAAGSRHESEDIHAEQIFFHEYAHHIQLQSATALPAWVTEGFAEFFASAVIQPDGGVVIGRYPPYRVSAISYIGISGEQIVAGMDPPQSDLQRHVFYGQGWLLTHYFAFEKKRRGQLVRYLRNIQEGKTLQQAAQSAFGDLKQLNRDLSAYKRGKLISLLLKPDILAVPPIAVRQLRDGEASVMPVRIQSTRGVDDRSSPGVADRARTAARVFPNDPAAQAALAEAEIDAKHYPEAALAADRALAADANNRLALILKGRALMELARTEPKKADWKSIRSWFARANRLDPDAAEPLMRFYQTFLVAGTTPTPNAVKGLIYAAQLVPQDETLRLMATEQLLRDDRTAEARQMFAPLAFAPHENEPTRATTARIMGFIVSGDAAAALRAIDEAKAKAKASRKR